MARKPAYDMVEIPSGKHPAWQAVENRATFEEDMRIHVYEAMDNLMPIMVVIMIAIIVFQNKRKKK